MSRSVRRARSDDANAPRSLRCRALALTVILTTRTKPVGPDWSRLRRSTVRLAKCFLTHLGPGEKRAAAVRIPADPQALFAINDARPVRACRTRHALLCPLSSTNRRESWLQMRPPLVETAAA